MSETIDFKKMKEELIELYENFLKTPEDKFIQEKAIKYDKCFGGLQAYNDYLKSQPVPQEIEMALRGLSAIYQYGLWEDTHDLSNGKIICKSKKILKELKKRRKKKYTNSPKIYSLSEKHL